jgi:hypothetical protein
MRSFECFECTCGFRTTNDEVAVDHVRTQHIRNIAGRGG